MTKFTALLSCTFLARGVAPRHLLGAVFRTVFQAVRFVPVFCFVSSAAVALDLNVTLSPAAPELLEKIEGQALLSTLAAADDPDTLDILASAQADYQRILAALYEDGYFGATISIKLDGREASTLSTISPPSTFSRAQIAVTTGSEFKFGAAQIGPLAPESELPVEFATGEVASTKVLEQSLKGAVSDWKDSGYPKVAPQKQKFTVNHNSKRFNAEVDLATGRLARIGKVTVTGTENVRPERVVEILGIEEGKVYAPEDLKDAQTRLRRTDAFKSVVFAEAEEIEPDGTLPIEVQVIDQIPRRFGFGAEISSDEGATISGFWMHRNLTGAADRLRFEGEISGIGSELGGSEGRSEYNITTRYERPATFNRDTDLFVVGALVSKDEATYRVDQASFDFGIKRYVTDNYEYRLSAGILHAREETVFGEDRYTLVTASYDGTLDYRNDPLRPTSGYFIRPTIFPYVGVDGERAGLRAYLDARTYFALGASENTVFALRGQLGSITGTSIPETPADFLFYSGGSGTVRGYSYQSLGVLVDGQTVTGGRSFAGMSAEVRVMRESGLGIVGFVDVGYIGTESFPDGSGDWHAGAGLGARYDTGLGPLRFDVAVPVGGSFKEDGFQFYIGIGEAF